MLKVIKYASLLLLGLINLLSFNACNNLDAQNEVEDLRILGIQTEPAEILYSPLYAIGTLEDRSPLIPLASYEIKVKIFAFDPRGGDNFKGKLFLCPDENGVSESCIDFDNDAFIEARSFKDSNRLSIIKDAFSINTLDLTAEDTEFDPSGQLKELEFTFNFSTEVIDAFLRDNEGNANFTFFPELPRFVIEIENLDITDSSQITKERAFKRIPLLMNLFDTSLPAGTLSPLFDILGLTPCTTEEIAADFIVGPTSCMLPLEGNLNPKISGFKFFNTEDKEEELEKEKELRDFPESGMEIIDPNIVKAHHYAETADILPEAILKMKPGSKLNLRPILLEGSQQNYQVLTFDIDNQKTKLENRYEDLVFNWYFTAGSGQDQSRSQALNDLDYTLTLPSLDEVKKPTDSNLNPRITLIGILRDQRGGTAFSKVIVELDDSIQ